ncbi:MAG: YihY/virulence factor BrkB family protein [Verrucomicrobiaceae bacterium]|nr:YihY/virulence factor BrkB family protein [Verrucomicrobiaceae bacterium]
MAVISPFLCNFVRAIRAIGKNWFLRDHSRSSAALAFYSLFSLVPLLVILTKLAGMLVGDEAAQASIRAASTMFLDQDSSAYLIGLVERQSAPDWTGWMSLMAFGMLLFAASKVVVELREMLSLIFGIRHREGRRGWLITFALKRGVPILLILCLGFVIAISTVLGTLFHFLTERIYDGYADLVLWKWIEQLGSLLILTLIFTFVLRWLPPDPPCLRASAGGAVVASLLLGGLRHLMNLYFQNAGVTSIYGAAVTLVVVLLWIYFSVQIFFVGAEAAGYIQRRQRQADREAHDQENGVPMHNAKKLCEKP